MYKKGQIILTYLLFFSFLSASAQFNTVRSPKKEYIIIRKVERESKEVDPLFNKSNIPQQQGKENKNKDTLNNDTIDSLITADTVTENITSPLNRLFLPLKKLFVTSHYGYRNDPFTGKRKFHKGTDFSTSSDSVYSIIPGKITRVGFEKKGLGNFVEIKNGDFTIIYGHLKTSIGTKNDNVCAGDIVGISGSTGKSTGDHLHLTVKFKGKVVDPLPLIKFIEKYLNGV